MTQKTSCTLIPNREFFIVVRRDSMMAKVYFSFRVSIPPLSLSLFLWLSRFGRRLFTGKVTGNYKWNTPFVVHLLNTKGVGMGDSLTGVLYLLYRLGGVCVVAVRNIAIGIVLSRSFRVRDCSRHICNRFE